MVEYGSRYHFGMARVEAYGLKHSSLLMGSTFLAGQYNWVGASQSLRISIKHKSTARPFAVLRKIRFFLSSPRHYHLFSQSQSLSYLFLIFLYLSLPTTAPTVSVLHLYPLLFLFLSVLLAYRMSIACSRFLAFHFCQLKCSSPKKA
ncbi:hypothetical protein B0H13DRAFT_363881 [Mycena leptocephala]|nr:hypothetical protein B0H13DRAFT_363881 [Mycena leptocephala]